MSNTKHPHTLTRIRTPTLKQKLQVGILPSASTIATSVDTLIHLHAASTAQARALRASIEGVLMCWCSECSDVHK